jgi:hypothetical protein
LSNHLQSVEIKETDCSISVKNSYMSSCKKVEHGVLQSSVLGPLLFLIYINDITENMQGAKDEFDLQNKIINVMKALEIWFQKDNLIINTEKTTAMSFHSKHEIFSETADNL